MIMKLVSFGLLLAVVSGIGRSLHSLSLSLSTRMKGASGRVYVCMYVRMYVDVCMYVRMYVS